MRKVHKLLLFRFGFMTALSLCSCGIKAQTGAEVYNSIKARPSPIRWCLPEAGDDAASIIGGVCKVYRNCLSNSNLDESVDRKPFAPLSVEQVENVRKCHQALYNAARVNPQIKGSSATQQWLQQLVYPGTQAKAFPIPGIADNPR